MVFGTAPLLQWDWKWVTGHVERDYRLLRPKWTLIDLFIEFFVDPECNWYEM